MYLCKVIFAATFGKGSRHLYQTALIRLGSLAGVSVTLGWLLASLLPPLPQPTGQTIDFLGSGVFMAQSVVLVALLAAYGIIRPNQKDTIARLLCSWPVSRSTAWFALLTPGLVLAAIAAIFIAPSLYVLFSQLHISWLYTTSSIVIGALTALGFLYGTPAPIRYLPFAISITALSVEYFLLRQLHADAGQLQNAGLLCWAGLIVLALGLLWRSQSHMAAEISHASPYKQVWFSYLPSGCWFVKKVWRGHVTSIGAFTTLAMSGIMAIIFWRLGIADLTLAGSMMSLLTAAFASDIRALAQKLHPVEIIGLKGVVYFISQQLGISLLVSLCITCPLWYTAMAMGWPITAPVLMVAILVPFVLGIASGLFASTLLAPGPRDISAQTMATLLAAGIFILPQLSIFSQLSSGVMTTIKVALAAALLTAAVYIEYKRNPFIWRTTHVAN